MKTIDFSGLARARTIVPVVVGVALFLTAVVTSAGERKKQSFLTRTIYVPVAFSVSREIHDVTLRVAGDDTVFLPLPRTFMFTYYPEREEVLPPYVDIRIHAEGCGMEDGFDVNMLLTPTEAVSGSDSIDFSAALAKAVRLHHRDIRLPAQLVRLKCKDLIVDKGENPTLIHAKHIAKK